MTETIAQENKGSSFLRQAFIVISWMAIVTLALMAGYHLQAENRLPAALDAAFAVALCGNFLFFRRHRRLQMAIRMGMGLGAASVIVVFAVEPELRYGGHLWFFTLPLASIFLLGKKEGTFWACFYFLVLLLVTGSGQSPLDPHRISFFLSYLVVTGFAYTYEMLREKAETGFAAANARLTEVSLVLSRYLSPQVCAEIISGQHASRIETRHKELSFFFADIVNFTGIAEHLKPEALAALLNSYLKEMTTIILNHGGTIDKYIGDAIVAFFGDPQSKGKKEDALAAVRMAIEMRQRICELREQWLSQGLAEPFHLRMGIASGFATVGNFGTEEHLDYTAIGSQVNLAARLESMAGPDQIFVSEATYLLVKDEFFCQKAGELVLKGISAPVSAYQVVDYQDKVEKINASSVTMRMP